MFIGAENIISPLGNSAEEMFEKLKNGESSIKNNKGVLASYFFPFQNLLLPLMMDSIKKSIELVDKDILIQKKTLLIVSTTKGEINQLSNNIRDAHLSYLPNNILKELSWINKGIVVSTACVSGLQSLIIANDMLNNDYYDNVIICGGDLASNFVLEGFQSFHALSKSSCRPFDENRNGLTLGEAVSTIIMSNNKGLYSQVPLKFLGGCSINDAHHISAPHRESNGLILSINNTLDICNIESTDIDFINAHGTATAYNDSMEAKAFGKLELADIPINSLKGFIGHTLGTAGVIETAICMQSMRNNLLLKCYGFSSQNFDVKLNLITENKNLDTNTILKTSSGFGGFNASAILQKI